MKIDSSYIGMESDRTYQSRTTGKLSFRVQIGNSVPDSQVGGGLNNSEDALGGENTLNEKQNDKTKEKLNEEQTKELTEAQEKLSQTVSVRRLTYSNASEMRALDDIRQQCILYLWTILFGKTRANEMSERMEQYTYQNSTSTSSFFSQGISAGQNGLQTLPFNGVRTFTITGERETMTEETESTSFSTKGVVKTADGREISFNLNVGMSRRFVQYTKESIQNVGAFIDPLVINLDGNIAEVSDQKFYFDLDADGEEEEISRLSKNSGYLALDKNGDGVINDGSELFGTSSGNGFLDLAAYDQDGNGWIDENDEIWDKLKIWVQDENGNSKLYSLSDKGVGAICLQNVSTEFEQKGQNGEVNAAIRNTGIFLYENGSAGTLQHLDLASTKIAQYA